MLTTTLPLAIEDLRVYYGDLRAVHGVSLEVEPRQILGLIGETGSGKSSVALAAARLLPATGRIEGSIYLDGEDITTMSRDQLRGLRGSRLGFVSQDAMAALNPVVPVGRQVSEVFEVHAGVSRSDALPRAIEALRSVRIPDPEAVARLYPHQLSGGMRQRVMIAIAMGLGPRLVIADEPTTGLDVSVQAEILSLVKSLREDLGVSFLWISHDMGVIAELADDVAVMYAGRLVEQGPAEELFETPRHPYTYALLQTLADLRSGAPGEPLYQIAGQPPSLHGINGCPFQPRCPRAQPRCKEEEPALVSYGVPSAACHFPLTGQVRP